MQAYTYGSPEGVKALKDALVAAEDKPHHLRQSDSQVSHLADALETAAIAGDTWAERFTGISWQESQLWRPHLAEFELDDIQMLGYVDALALAYVLGNEFAGDMLSGLACCVDVEWI